MFLIIVSFRSQLAAEYVTPFRWSLARLRVLKSISLKEGFNQAYKNGFATFVNIDIL